MKIYVFMSGHELVPLSAHLDDVVPAEDSACVASIAVFSDSAL